MHSFVIACIVAVFAQSQSPAPSPLRIVVLEGEDAVNIVQQKTAVRPLIEVRDRNNLPVAGATVTFTIGGGQPASFVGGVQTLTVTTNAAGQAAASGLNAIGSGAVQIQVQAAYQGQIATAAISQTNVVTAAAASQAGSTAGGAAGGGGGGLSGTTIGIIGAAVGGGALAATQLTGGDEGSASGGRGTPLSGPFSGQIVVTTVTGSSTCVSTRAITGTLTITLRDGNSAGRAEATGTRSEISVTASPTCSPQAGPVPLNLSADVTGGPSNLTFHFESSGTSSTPTGGSVTSLETTTFSGSLSGGAITGTLTFTHATRGSNATSSIAGNGTTTIPITLR